MTQSVQPISADELLVIANNLLKQHEDYLPGVKADSVKQRGDVLVFNGDFYLDEQGLPSGKTTVVFNLFKYLAHSLSSQYRLSDVS
ncbi:hypothetical protein BTJ39_04370 [Izhakiella australiensis]|uniref:DUF2498 domain-containing protein n=1 Tax=Izhakiella australiensis TaxID=1926881 RepID=A0A1S8YPZ6_9GAMM|nr:DUF2498 family protein [Izhakiella australiensis]OON41209.1 hypothetical protein BTJ39_04370 [Izhakiella australiensis]